MALAPPVACATERGSLQLSDLSPHLQAFSRAPSGDHRAEIGSADKLLPFESGPPVILHQISACSAFRILVFNFFFLTLRLLPLPPKHCQRWTNSCVLTLLGEGGLFPFWNSWLPHDLGSMISSRKLWFLYTVQHFLVRMGVTFSCGFLHPKQEQNSQCTINSTTFRLASTLVWRINYMATDGKAQAQSHEDPADAFGAMPTAGLVASSGSCCLILLSWEKFPYFFYKIRHAFKKVGFFSVFFCLSILSSIF